MTDECDIENDEENSLEASGGDYVFVLDADGHSAHRRRVRCQARRQPGRADSARNRQARRAVCRVAVGHCWEEKTWEMNRRNNLVVWRDELQ